MNITKFSILIFILALFSNIFITNSELSEDSGYLKKVDSKYVCMVTNKLFSDEQIEVDVEGKKYYGCCEMCKAKLADDISTRQSTDPVSGKTVDKALSVIGASSSGDVYYFESYTNLQNFNNN